jgi:hypothetical protein
LLLLLLLLLQAANPFVNPNGGQLRKSKRQVALVWQTGDGARVDPGFVTPSLKSWRTG